MKNHQIKGEKRLKPTLRKIIWVLDDDPLILKVVEHILTKMGYTVRSFQTMESFLDAYFAQPTEPTLLLVDYLLGDTTGLQVLLDLKGKGFYPYFVAMTGFGHEKIAVSFMKAGALDYVIKGKGFNEYLPLAIQSAFEHIGLNNKLREASESLKKSYLKQKQLNSKIRAKNLELAAEKGKVEKLLKNMLPEKIALELLNKGAAKARYFPCVTVLFADVENFSATASRFSPIDLVERLDTYFSIFEVITLNLNLEKIKTIGDCYMCAGGIPEADTLSPARVVLAGLLIQQAAAKQEETSRAAGRNFFRWRIGIHTGEVVAGVLGKEKYSYDIWGDAANKAHWMEQASSEGMVNISKECFDHVSEFFECTLQEPQQCQKLNCHPMYFASKLKPKYSADANGLLPNRLFYEATGLFDKQLPSVDSTIINLDK